MGWTIDVPPTGRDEFAAVLDTAPVREFPEGSPLIYARDANGHWDRPRLRPEVATQVAGAIEEAKKRAGKLKDEAVSASLHGHTTYEGVDENDVHPDNGETYVRVDVSGHDASVLAEQVSA